MTKPSTASALREGATEIAENAPVVDIAAAPHVIEALRRVIRDLPGIGRDQTASAQQGGYAYRGIEQITQHTQGLFARHCVVFVPRVVHYEIREITVNNKPWTDTVELVEYDVYGPGGVEDKITVGPILAIGRDNSDKGANKCLTQAYKYALLQALSISDAKDDADGSTHEADAATRPTISKDDHEARDAVLLDLTTLLPDVGAQLVADLEARSGCSVNDALTDPGWRKWLSEAIAFHKEPPPEVET